MTDTRNDGVTAEELKERVDIVDVIGRVVNLKKAGANYKGLCPFHNEKTPSFMVSDTKQIFNCFGCGEKGDIFTFVEKYYNLDFLAAAEKIADEAGLTLKKSGKKNPALERYQEMNREAAVFFYKALRKTQNPGLEYMLSRGLDMQTMRDFGIGWADGEWTSLRDHLASKGYKDEEMLAVGLVSRSEKGKIYDKFRNRVIFPIQNTSGKVIAFGGRALGDAMPKYLNSPESDVFKKSYNLYALNVTRQFISKEDRAILVEGYMDVIGLYQLGVKNATASMGTALTDNQANMLSRYTKNIVLAYDSDGPGQIATARGMDILKQKGCDIGIVVVPEGKDPDEFIRKHGKEAWYDLVRNSLSFADYKFMKAKERFDMDTTRGRLGFVREAVKILNELSPVEADMYIRKIAAENDISEGAIRAEMENAGSGRNIAVRKHQDTGEELLKEERELFRVLLTDPGYIEREKEFNSVFRTDAAAGIFNALKDVYEPGKPIDTAKLGDILGDGTQKYVEQIMDDEMLAGDVEEMYRSLMKRSETEILKQRQDELQVLISMAENIEDPEKINEMMKELREIQKKLSVRRK